MSQAKPFPYQKLISWFQRNARDLPWRKRSDSYSVTLAEFMLQQTRVDTVIERYNRWLDRWGDWSELAKASEDDAVAEWAGLGYYSRARRLHQIARIVTKGPCKDLPKTPDELRKLPGIGPYAAASIAAIAFNFPSPALDGNVRRVLSRYLADKSDPSPSQDALFHETLAGPLQKTKNRRAFVEGMMELGATICIPRKPDCPSCPLNRECEAFRAGKCGEYPKKKKAIELAPLHIAFCWVKAGETFLLRRRKDKGRFAGMFEPPLTEAESGECAISKLKKTLYPHDLSPLAEYQSSITRYKVTWHPFVAKLDKPQNLNGYSRFSANEIASLPVISRCMQSFPKDF